MLAWGVSSDVGVTQWLRSSPQHGLHSMHARGYCKCMMCPQTSVCLLWFVYNFDIVIITFSRHWLKPNTAQLLFTSWLMVFVHLLQYFPDLLRSTKGRPRGLLQAHGETWRRTRQILSPTFSAVKMKMVIHILIWEFFTEASSHFFFFFFFFFSWLSLQMVPLMKSSCDTLVEKLGEFAESGKSLDVFRYGSWTYWNTYTAHILVHMHAHTCTHAHARTHTHTHHAGPMVLSPWRPF